MENNNNKNFCIKKCYCFEKSDFLVNLRLILNKNYFKKIEKFILKYSKISI